MIKHKIARGVILLFMRKFGFLGWTSFWNTIYYIDEKSKNNPRIKKHELQHIKQIQQDGMIKFTIKYLFYLYKFGYSNNPYEIEAREAENG